MITQSQLISKVSSTSARLDGGHLITMADGVDAYNTTDVLDLALTNDYQTRA